MPSPSEPGAVEIMQGLCEIGVLDPVLRTVAFPLTAANGDPLNGLKMRVPGKGSGIPVHPIVTDFETCRDYGRVLAESLAGKARARTIEFADL